MNLQGFFKECHEKDVFKMLSIYLVSSWVILQVLALIAEPLNFPEKSVTYLILILIIGFPIHMYYIWKFRLRKLEKRQTGDDTIKIYKSPFHKMYFSALIIISSLSAFSAVIIVNTNLISDIKLQEANGNDKIAVLKFEDFTGDEKLESIGDMAANWIVHGITENGLAQVISPKVVNDYTSIIKSQAGSVADAKNLVKTYFKPGKVVTGGFYKKNGKLLLQASIMDGLIDKTLISFKTIECESDSPLTCIEELKQDVLGYLTIAEKQDNSGYISKDNDQKASYFEETPPKFQAFQYNFMAEKHMDNDSLYVDYLNKAISADPNYFEPKIHLISYYLNMEDYRIADSLLKRINMNSNLSPRQQNYLFEYESLIKAKYDKAYQAIKKEYKIAYLDLPTNMSTMVIAMQYLNRPKDIESIYNEIPMGDMNLVNCYYCGHRYFIKGFADIELKRYQQVIDSLPPITNTIESGFVKEPLIMAYVRSGNIDALNEQFERWNLSMENKKELIDLYFIAGNEFLLVNDLDNATAYFDKVINSPESIKGPTDMANSYYFKQDYKTAQNLLENIHTNKPNNIDVVVKLAISNYKNGNTSRADQFIKSLDGLRTDFQFGQVDYGMAQYYAVLNDEKKALEYLLKAVASGRWFTTTTFQNDPHFLNFKDKEEFRRILNYWNKLFDDENVKVQ